MIARHSTHPEICGCCLAPARGRGFSAACFVKGHLYFAPAMWFCGDPACGAAMIEVYAMPADIFEQHLDAAIEQGRKTAGAHAVQQIGKTDLAQMTASEYHGFARAMIEATIADLRCRVTGNVPTEQ